MAQRGMRDAAATIVGWVLAIALVFLFFGAIFATIRVVIRLAAVGIVLIVLLWLYFRLKAGD